MLNFKFHIKLYLIQIFKFFNYFEFLSKLKIKLNQLYTLWIIKNISSFGNSTFIQFPSIIKGSKYIRIGNNFVSGNRLRLECWDIYKEFKFKPTLYIGDNVNFNYNVHIGCINSIHIGDYVLIGSNVLITDHQHGFINSSDTLTPPVNRELYSKGPVIIEDNVWVGENVCIMPNVRVGKGSIIGCNSVVTQSFKEYSVIAGNPAKLIRNLNEY